MSKSKKKKKNIEKFFGGGGGGQFSWRHISGGSIFSGTIIEHLSFGQIHMKIN